MGKVLVGYVSKTNTTKEIAERIGSTLTRSGIETDVLPLSAVDSIEPYDALVLGSPINAMRLLPEFGAFVRAHAGIDRKTAGLFVVAYVYEHGRGLFRRMMQGSIKKARLATKARVSAVFGGRVPGPMPGPARLIFGLPRGLPADLRDWARIDEWAEKVVTEIRPSSDTPSAKPQTAS